MGPDLAFIYSFTVGFTQVISKLLTAPHVAFDFVVVEFGVLFLDGVVCQVVFSGLGLGIIFLNAKSNIALIIQPNSQRIPVGHEHPLANIKFSALHDQWVFDAFLDDPKSSVTLQISYSVHHPLIRLINLNTTTPRAASWLQKPQIFCAIHIEL